MREFARKPLAELYCLSAFRTTVMTHYSRWGRRRQDAINRAVKAIW
jgi:hypothetical protein